MAIGDDWPDLLTTGQVAKIFQVHPITVKRWGNRGRLPYIRINSRGDRRYRKDAVMSLLGIEPEEKTAQPRQPIH